MIDRPTPPLRRPAHQRRTAPLPPRAHRKRRVRPLARLAGVLGRWLERTPLGRALARRLRGQLVLTGGELHLARGGEGLDGLRIAFVSDLHAGMFMGEAELEELFARIAAARPELVCLGGDLVDTRAEQVLLYRRALRRLAPPLGVFAVPGNHEYACENDLKLFRDLLGESGVRVLINQGERLQRNGETLWLAGADDHSLGRPDLGLALYGAREHEPIVLLAHHPDLFFEAASLGVDLQLSGHTHGGQIVIGGRTPCRHTRLGYWRGHFRDLGAQLCVSRGAGVTWLPLRVCAPPEILLLTLRTGNVPAGGPSR